MYDLSWPHRHLFDCDSITSSAEPVKGVFLVCNLAISSLPTCSAGRFEVLSNGLESFSFGLLLRYLVKGVVAHGPNVIPEGWLAASQKRFLLYVFVANKEVNAISCSHWLRVRRLRQWSLL